MACIFCASAVFAGSWRSVEVCRSPIDEGTTSDVVSVVFVVVGEGMFGVCPPIRVSAMVLRGFSITPWDRVAFSGAVVLHEFAHGLGFQTGRDT
ncbi:hypothetical protein L0222_15280 [bacterium]|nr:hypothetical protein [bacterium]MCI0603809.1 hypothetical protein [bacterium]